MRKTGLSLVITLFLLILIGSCTEETKVDISANLNPANMPTMATRNISTFISDSGITQYKIVTPIWYIYDEVDTPFWFFPKGVYLQKFDDSFKVINTVAADSATFFKNSRVWKLEGNVEMTKVPDELFLSPRLFWDQRQQRLYSDTFIHIENATHVIEGTGFESDERLTSYRILYPTGIFPVDEDNLKGSN